MGAPKRFYRKLWFSCTRRQLDLLDREVALYGGDRSEHLRRAVDLYFSAPQVRRRQKQRAS